MILNKERQHSKKPHSIEQIQKLPRYVYTNLI